MDGVDERHGEVFPQDNLVPHDDLSTIQQSYSSIDEGEPKENAKNDTELITLSNLKEDEPMTSTVQTKTKANRKVVAKKKIEASSNKSRIPSKLKFRDEVRDSDLEGSSSDEKFMEEFDSGDSDFSSSTDSDDLSQEFSDEDRLMEYYEKKLREHAIVGNFHYNSDFSEDSEPSEELKKLVDDTFKPKPPGKLDQVHEGTTKSTTRKIGKVKKDQAGSAKTPDKLQTKKDPPSAKKPTHTIKVNMKSVITGLKSENSAGKEAVSKNLQNLSVSKNKPSEKVSITSLPLDKARKTTKNIVTPMDLKKAGNDRNKSLAVRRTGSTPIRTGAAQAKANEGASEGSESYQKVVDYLARIKQVQKSISEINGKINVDSGNAADLEIIKSARAAILKQRDRCRKQPQVKQKVNHVPSSASASSTASDGYSARSEERFAEQLEDEVVDRILNAALGAS